MDITNKREWNHSQEVQTCTGMFSEEHQTGKENLLRERCQLSTDSIGLFFNVVVSLSFLHITYNRGSIMQIINNNSNITFWFQAACFLLCYILD